MSNNTKLCPMCGEEFPDSYSFCPYDGEELEDIPEFDRGDNAKENEP